MPNLRFCKSQDNNNNKSAPNLIVYIENVPSRIEPSYNKLVLSNSSSWASVPLDILFITHFPFKWCSIGESLFGLHVKRSQGP